MKNKGFTSDYKNEYAKLFTSEVTPSKQRELKWDSSVFESKPNSLNPSISVENRNYRNRPKKVKSDVE